MYYAITRGEDGKVWELGRVSYPMYDTYVAPETFNDPHAAIRAARAWCAETCKREHFAGHKATMAENPNGAEMTHGPYGIITQYTFAPAYDIEN